MPPRSVIYCKFWILKFILEIITFNFHLSLTSWDNLLTIPSPLLQVLSVLCAPASSCPLVTLTFHAQLLLYRVHFSFVPPSLASISHLRAQYSLAPFYFQLALVLAPFYLTDLHFLSILYECCLIPEHRQNLY